MEKIKKCNKCNCYSSDKADSCCWCGSKELIFIDGVAEVEKDEKMAMKMAKWLLGGFVISIIGSILAFTTSEIFIVFLFLGLIMIVYSLIKLKFKYGGSIDNFSNIVNEQITYQRDFTNQQVKYVKEHWSSSDKDFKIINLQKNLNNDFNITMSNQKFIELVNTWLDVCVSPEVIKTRVNNYLKEDKYKQEIENITNHYYSEKASSARAMSKRINNILDSQQQQVSNIQTTGLDFGIITNNVGSAVLYDAMNNKAHQNQYNKQLNPVLKNTNNQLSSLKREINIGSTITYNKYKKEIINYLKEKLNADTLDTKQSENL